MCFSFKADIHPDELKELANAQTAARSFELFYKENPEGFGTTIFPNAYALGMVKMKQGNVIRSNALSSSSSWFKRRGSCKIQPLQRPN